MPSGSVDGWCLRFTGYDPLDERRRETLCTVGNGYFATRGAWAGSRADDRHYPGTYLAGCYNRLTDQVGERSIETESLVNLPDWLPLTLAIDDGPWLTPEECEVLDHTTELDLRRGILTRSFRLRSPAGQVVAGEERRFVSMAEPHLAGQALTVSVENWSGTLRLATTVNGDVGNTGVARYSALRGDHLTDLEPSIHGDTVLVSANTRQAHTQTAVATRTIASSNSQWRDHLDTTSAGRELAVEVTPGEVVSAEKVVAIYSSRDHGISEPVTAALTAIGNAAGFDELLAAHVLAWSQLWGRFALDLSAPALQFAVRLDLFHLLQSVSPHTAAVDAGVPARGLHGEAYRGHVFWDELFVFPVLTWRSPALTRALLGYRYRRLPAARRAAREAGYRGAMYPWQSGSDGREESQRVHLNPLSGRWTVDATYRQRHVGLAVAATMWRYVETTGDREFLSDQAAEVIVEVARFFADLATYDEARARFVLRGVAGPDEFHTGYPDRPADGIDNSAYTNVLAAWILGVARRALDALPTWRRAELTESLDLHPDELAHWDELTRRIYVPFHDGVISQFEGYAELAELDWPAYRARYGDLRRLDRILESEGRDVVAYRVSKQADVLMLLYVLTRRELREVMGRLGYELDGRLLRRTVDYYLARTCHGSSLSAVVHAWGLASIAPDQALGFLQQASDSDLAPDGTTAEGIHLAAMAGSVDLIQRCFTGLSVAGDTLRFRPRWPQRLGTLRMPLWYRGRRLTVEVSSNHLTVTLDSDADRKVPVRCHGKTHVLKPGGTATWNF
ncbi:trehalose 6-phosphate phosphatase [Kribbella amoyensis]|uniref:Trehalose 6-phosphate phosphatase n=1 Tax=Kribbella amoyensis TaxID=996641 RepID=A0A561C0H0_9ACTN|nr:trehalose 6-phosphate phosphatase [Kribbella amoyensis]